MPFPFRTLSGEICCSRADVLCPKCQARLAKEKTIAAGIARLYALGPLSAATVEAFGDGARHFDGHEALAAALAKDLAGIAGIAPVVLVKGSRGSAMDKIVKALLEGEAADAA